MPEDGGERGGTAGSPDEALLGEGWQWAAVPNLDQFFTRTYRWVHSFAYATALQQVRAVGADSVCCHHGGSCSGRRERWGRTLRLLHASQPNRPSRPASSLAAQVLGGEGVCGDAHSSASEPGSSGVHRWVGGGRVRWGRQRALPSMHGAGAVLGRRPVPSCAACCHCTAFLPACRSLPAPIFPHAATTSAVLLLTCHFLPPHPCSRHVSVAAAVRQLGGAAGPMPQSRHLRPVEGAPIQHSFCR